MKTEILTSLAVYIVSFINVIIAVQLYRMAKRKNNKTKEIINQSIESINAKSVEIKENLNRASKQLREFKPEIKIHIMPLHEMDGTPSDAQMKDIMHPANIVRDMDYDQFIDWLDMGTLDDVMSAHQAFIDAGMMQHVHIIDGYLKNKYPNMK